MKRFPFTLLVIVFFTSSVLAQDAFPLPAFDKVKVSPRIALIMEEGLEESVHFAFENIDEEALNFDVRNGTLEIYLEGAKNLEKRKKVRTRYGKMRESIYADGRVIAYLTFRQINKLTVKGEENVRVNGTISDETFKLKVFGDIDISFTQLNTERLKVKMFGDCRLTIETGESERQKYSLFGDHLIDTEHFHGRKVKATSFGESEFRMNAEHLKVTALGVADINCPRDTQLRKFIIGESSVRRFSGK